MDASEDAQRAAKKVMEIKKQWNSEVIAFHSVEHHFIPQQMPLSTGFSTTFEYSIPQDNYLELQEIYKKKGEKILEETEKLFENETMVIETRLILDKSPEDYIFEKVEEEDFDLVVLGCKGAHKKLKEVFIGSVAQSVLNRAKCDVLIVR